MNITDYPEVSTVFMVTALIAGLVKRDFKQVALFFFGANSIYYALHSAMHHVEAYQFLEPIAVYLILGIAWTIPLVFLDMLSWKIKWKKNALTNWLDQNTFSVRLNDLNNVQNGYVPHVSLAFKYWNNKITKDELFSAIDRSANPSLTTEQKENFLKFTAQSIAQESHRQENKADFLDLYEKDSTLNVKVNRHMLSKTLWFNILAFPYVLARVLIRLVTASVEVLFLKYTRKTVEKVEKASNVSNLKIWMQENKS